MKSTDSQLLSGREREVLQLVAEGKTSNQIAEELHISAKTVETHRQQVMLKLNIKNVAELTKYAVREGLDHALIFFSSVSSWSAIDQGGSGVRAGQKPGCASENPGPRFSKNLLGVPGVISLACFTAYIPDKNPPRMKRS